MDLQKFRQGAEMCILCHIILKADVLHYNDMRKSNNKWNRFFQMCSQNVIVVICINVLWSIEKQQPYEFSQHLQIQQMPDFITSFACIERFCSQQWGGGNENYVHLGSGAYFLTLTCQKEYNYHFQWVMIFQQDTFPFPAQKGNLQRHHIWILCSAWQ